MLYLFLLVFLLAIYFYANKHYRAFLLAYFALMSNMFMLAIGESPIRGSDLCLFLSLVLIPFVLYKNKNAYSTKHDRYAKFIYVIICFYLIEFLITITTRAEYLVPALKVIRGIFLLLSYFIFKTIPLEKYKKFLIIGFWIALIQGVLFYLQFLGINLLSGRFDSEAFSFNFALNIPTLTYFYIFFSLRSSYTRKYRYLLLTFFLGILLLTFVRSILIAAIIGIAVYLLINKSKKQSVTLLFVSLLFLPIVFATIDKKSDASNSSVSTMDDIRQVFSGVDNLRKIDTGSGTFSFRIGMFVERVDYLIKHPQYLLIGVGTIHEDSPKCYNRFNFYLGTRNEGRYYEKCIIESGDITWVPIVLRYGLIGLCLHLYVFIYILKLGKKRKDILQVVYPWYVVLFVLSFSGSYFEIPLRLYEICFVLAMIRRSDVEHTQLQL